MHMELTNATRIFVLIEANQSILYRSRFNACRLQIQLAAMTVRDDLGEDVAGEPPTVRYACLSHSPGASCQETPEMLLPVVVEESADGGG